MIVRRTAKSSAPLRDRKPPEIFWRSFIMRRSRSASLLVKGTCGSVRKRRVASFLSCSAGGPLPGSPASPIWSSVPAPSLSRSPRVQAPRPVVEHQRLQEVMRIAKRNTRHRPIALPVKSCTATPVTFPQAQPRAARSPECRSHEATACARPRADRSRDASHAPRPPQAPLYALPQHADAPQPAGSSTPASPATHEPRTTPPEPPTRRLPMSRKTRAIEPDPIGEGPATCRCPSLPTDAGQEGRIPDAPAGAPTEAAPNSDAPQPWHTDAWVFTRSGSTRHSVLPLWPAWPPGLRPVLTKAPRATLTNRLLQTVTAACAIAAETKTAFQLAPAKNSRRAIFRSDPGTLNGSNGSERLIQRLTHFQTPANPLQLKHPGQLRSVMRCHAMSCAAAPPAGALSQCQPTTLSPMSSPCLRELPDMSLLSRTAV